MDKRTKEYKEWKRKNKGVGDVIEDITKATGIKAVVKSVFGEDCGCEQRKETINKIFGKRNVKCLEEDEYHFLTTVFEGKGKIKPDVQIKMKAIFERVFSLKLNSSCLSCSFISEVYRPLFKLWSAK